MMTYEDALDGVKISHFIRRGIAIRGVIHVGTNWGEEIMYYLALGMNVVGFEPLVSAYTACVNTYLDAIKDGRLKMYQMGLGSAATQATIREIITPTADTGGSSFLREDEAGLADCTILTQEAAIRTYADIVTTQKLNPSDYNCLVIDVQGMELEVLKGMGSLIHFFDCLNIECSEVPMYEGEASAQEVIDYLAERGFRPDTPIEPHNDILFVREA